MTAALIASGCVIAGLAWVVWAQRREIDLLNDVLIDHADWLNRRKQSVEASDQMFFDTCAKLNARTIALQAICEATADGKSGTAVKVYRMASEALR